MRGCSCTQHVSVCDICLTGAGQMELPSMLSLHHFAVAGACGSFAGAALECGVTAATVGQSIARLEGYVGARLFIRPGGGRSSCTPTQLGRIALPVASRVVYLASTLKG